MVCKVITTKCLHVNKRSNDRSSLVGREVTHHKFDLFTTTPPLDTFEVLVFDVQCIFRCTCTKAHLHREPPRWTRSWETTFAPVSCKATAGTNCTHHSHAHFLNVVSFETQFDAHCILLELCFVQDLTLQNHSIQSPLRVDSALSGGMNFLHTNIVFRLFCCVAFQRILLVVETDEPGWKQSNHWCADNHIIVEPHLAQIFIHRTNTDGILLCSRSVPMLLTVNVSRAHVHAKAQGPVLVRLPVEGRMRSDIGNLDCRGRTCTAHGTRQASGSVIGNNISKVWDMSWS